MRSILYTSILALAVALPQAANGQNGAWRASLGGGLTPAVGSAGDHNKTGGHGTLTVGYSPFHSNHTWSMEVGFHQLDRKFAVSEGITKGHSNILVFMGRYDRDVASGLYVTGGFGMVRNEFPIKVGDVALTNTDSRPGLAAGVGVRVLQRIFLEGRVVHAFSKPGTTYVPITLGVRF